MLETKKPEVVLTQRARDFIAHDALDDTHWEAGTTEAQALQSLMITRPELRSAPIRRDMESYERMRGCPSADTFD